MITSATSYWPIPSRKHASWCRTNGVEHSWEPGPTLTSNPPIPTRRCINCGQEQRQNPGDWLDYPV